MDVSIGRQIDGLVALRKSIETLEQDFRTELTFKPERLLNDLVSMGFPADLANTYRIKYMSEDNEHVNKILRFINTYMISYIDGQITTLRQMGMSGGGYGGF